MKYDELIKSAIEMIDNDDKLFCDLVNELDGYMGFADGFRCWDMSELDDYYYGSKASQLIKDLTEDFNINDNYFYFSIYGLESTDDMVTLYRDNVNSGELLDNVINNYNRITIYCSDFDDLMNEIIYYEEE